MPTKYIAMLAAFFSSLVVLIAGYVYLSTSPLPTRKALPPVEIAPPVRDISPRITPMAPQPNALPKETTTPMPQGIELIQNDKILQSNVRKMREKLLEAAQSGNIGRLSVVFQTNETQPIFTRGSEKDPVSFWKKSSGDGQGREILSALSNILMMPAALIYKGTAQEMYVWPYLAHVPLNKLSPSQEVDIYKLLTAQDVKDMQALGKWAFWRVGIGPDGTLHYFVAGD